jgi:glycosyltransferase involved in cell wall biosynthesis
MKLEHDLQSGSPPDKRPELSLYIATKNRVKIFERSLVSILREVESERIDAEIIIIDGGSTDGTVDVLRRHQDRLAYWISEPDSCMAEAANKAIARVRADVIFAIGDDDELVPGRLRMMLETVKRLPEFGVVAGHNDVYVEKPDGQVEPYFVPKFRGEVTRSDMCKWGMHHGILVPETCFFRKEVFQKHGGYDLKWKWWGFLDLFYRFINNGVRFFVVPIPILKTYQTMQSDTWTNLNNPKFWEEFFRVIHKNTSWRWWLWRWLDGTFNPSRKLLHYAHRFSQATGIRPKQILRSLFQRGGERK